MAHYLILYLLINNVLTLIKSQNMYSNSTKVHDNDRLSWSADYLILQNVDSIVLLG